MKRFTARRPTEEQPRQERSATQDGIQQGAADQDDLVFTLPPNGPPFERRSRRAGSGWLIGLILGALLGLWMLPPVRYTLGSQLRFALAQDSLPWLRTYDAQRSLVETVRLDAAAALLPDDYLLQVGRATALAAPVPPGHAAPHSHEAANASAPSLSSPGVAAPNAPDPDAAEDLPDHTLIRLTTVARDFPLAPGAQAHLARSMMMERVRIQRPDLTPFPPRLVPPRYTDVKLMTWALNNGERADPDNAFWPAMLAATYFAAGRDRQGLDALTLCMQKSRWDSYLYEEVLGQWRLYSLAYGDHGAAQQIGPLTLLAFPHLRELRRMAEAARLEADHAAARGEIGRAIQIRRAIRLLGHVLRDNATWAYEALYGTDLLLIAACDSDTPQSGIRTVQDWEPQAQGYLAFLRKNHRAAEIALLYAEVEESCRLRTQVDVARADASYPGVPPGIPLIALFSDWMTGVSLLQQAALLCLCASMARLWPRRKTRRSRRQSAFLWGLGCLLAVGMGMLLFTSLPSSRLAVAIYAVACALFVAACGSLQARTLPDDEADGGQRDGERAEFRWRRGTTLRFVVALAAGTGALLYSLRGLFSSLHPVALLLSSMMGIAPPATGAHALQVGLLACALPLFLIVGLCCRALLRRVPVTAAIVYGLGRMFLPALACLSFAYLLLLNQTLRLDALATHAINEAAKDDLHWVLTHSENAD